MNTPSKCALPSPTLAPGSDARRAAGFTLLEILVAIVVIAVGLLGIAGMQARGLLYNTDANLRSQAAFLTYEIAERIRANSGALSDYAIGKTDSKPSDPGCASSACAPSSLADYDLNQWLTNVGGLPEGKGSIVVSTGTPDTATIAVFWTDPQGTASFQVTVEL